MGRPPSLFNRIGARRTIRRYGISDTRNLIRKLLFGKNAVRYPHAGRGGDPLNEFELQEIALFIMQAHIDKFTPATFNPEGGKRTKARDNLAASDPQRAHFDLSGSQFGPGYAEDGSGGVGGSDELDELLRELDSESDDGDVVQRPGLEDEES